MGGGGCRSTEANGVIWLFLLLTLSAWGEPTRSAGYPPWLAPGLAALGFLGLGALLMRRAQTPYLAPIRLQESPDVQDRLIGCEIGPYYVTERLGEGGMAVVYKARVKDSQEPVAIKIIRPDQLSADYQQRFEREIKVSMKLNHPNVLRIIDWGQQDSLTYLVMEFVEGTSFSRLIPPEGLALSDAMAFLPGIIEGLAHAHSLGIVHRDLKPDNVMVSSNGRVKLMDFGLARNQEVNTVTMHGTAMGTPQYMAPEQVLRGPDRSGLTDKTDQYALGVMIFEALTGRRPFEVDDDPMKLILMHINQAPPSLTALKPQLPAELDGVVQRMLAKEPDERYPSVKDAGAALFVACREVVPNSAAALESLQKILPRLAATPTVAAPNTSPFNAPTAPMAIEPSAPTAQLKLPPS